MTEDKIPAGYCGMYCKSCTFYTGELKTTISKLKELIQLYEIGRLGPLLGTTANLSEFLRTLDDLEKTFGSCPSCRSGGIWSECPLKKCCTERGLTFCYECENAPCSDLNKFRGKHFLLPSPHYAKQ